MWIVVLGTISLAAWLFALARMTQLPFLLIDRIEISGADADIVPELTAAAAQAIQGKYAGIFSRSNIFTYPKSAVERAVEGVSPRVEHATVARSSSNTLEITVQERTKAAVVCANLPDWSGSELKYDDSDICYFADPSGFVFEAASSTGSSDYERYYMPYISNKPAEHLNNIAGDKVIGDYAASTTEFTAVRKFFDNVKAGGIDAQAVLSKGGGEYELYARNPVPDTAGQALASGTPGGISAGATGTVVIYFNDRNGFDNESANLVAFWSDALDKARTAGKYVSFDSIDLRYGPNVFYRLAK